MTDREEALEGSPEAAYEIRRRAREDRLATERGRVERLGTARLITALATVIAVIVDANFHIAIAPVALAGFAIVVSMFVLGDRLNRRVRFAERGVAYYERGIERIGKRRNDRGETGERFLDPTHPYAADLDLFGRHSLFQFLSVCRTRAGEQRLSLWLLNPAAADEIASRHEAVRDLRERIDLREDLAVIGADFGAHGNPEALRAWATAPLTAVPGVLVWLAPIFALLIVGLLVAYVATRFENAGVRLALVMTACVEGAIFWRWRADVQRIAAATEAAGGGLALIHDLLARFERESFSSRRLRGFTQAMREPESAAKAVGSLTRLVELLQSRHSWLLQILGPLVLWTTQTSFAVERWRASHGASVPAWLDAFADFEALSSFAGAWFEHPQDTLPEVFETADAVFEGDQLCHPLLGRCVPNRVELGVERLLIVSGSNMSGKSTLLRTIGANAVLALAGAPVRAAKLSLSVMRIGASIRIMDSLDDGISRFYAEILRLRQITSLDPPFLFLFDELLAGTNSHDRRIGAASILQTVVARGGVGLATTHDLALADIAQDLTGAVNVHFEDHVTDGRMEFDYRMRPGIVTHSNALELMRSIGLDV